jgi:hypothetical protein
VRRLRLRRPSLRTVAIAACGLTALAVVLTPWYALDEYRPNGWDATVWGAAAAILALLAIVALRLERLREAVIAIALAAACIAFRAIVPPDFGFGFDGLEVSTEREGGLWVARAGGVVALAACVAGARRSRAPAEASAAPG